jgi:CheY-like chemotaxis protein
MLLKPHYKVEEADGGLRAMQIIQKNKIDLVTLDMRMPGMDGVAVLKTIKQYNPNIEVMIITGHGPGVYGSAADLIQLGARGYYTKPFDAPELMTGIAQAIGNRKGMSGSKSPSQEDSLNRKVRNFRIPLISISSLTHLKLHPTCDILIQDLCLHGMGIHCPEKFQTGEFVRVEITFAVNQQETVTESIVGEVVWTHLLQNGITYSTRIRFDHLALENPRLFAYIKRFEEMN